MVWPCNHSYKSNYANAKPFPKKLSWHLQRENYSHSLNLGVVLLSTAFFLKVVIHKSDRPQLGLHKDCCQSNVLTAVWPAVTTSEVDDSTHPSGWGEQQSQSVYAEISGLEYWQSGFIPVWSALWPSIPPSQHCQFKIYYLLCFQTLGRLIPMTQLIPWKHFCFMCLSFKKPEQSQRNVYKNK